MPVRLPPWAEIMKKLLIIFLTLFLANCSKSPLKLSDSFMPEIYDGRVADNDYGEYPKNYQKILKDYLQENIINHESAKVEFINKPTKLSIIQLGDIYTGHRICLSINSKNMKSIYTGFKTHLFVIKDSEVILHLYDSGLLKIPFELCVNRKSTSGIFLNEIPDQPTEIQLDEMDIIDLESKDKSDLIKDNIYIVCNFKDNQRTFYFNESKNILVESLGINEVFFNNIKFSTTHILGNNKNEEILINRVTGNLLITEKDKTINSGSCDLLSRKKF